jgi:hypothetical protein
MLRILSGPESQLSRRSEPGSVRRSSVGPGVQSQSRGAMTHCSNCISPISRWKYEFCATQYDFCLQKNCPQQGDNGGRKAVIRIYPLFESVIRSSWSISRGLEVVFPLVRGEAAEECSRRCGSRGLRRIVRRPFAGASSISKTSPELAEGSIGFRSGEVRGASGELSIKTMSPRSSLRRELRSPPIGLAATRPSAETASLAAPRCSRRC